MLFGILITLINLVAVGLAYYANEYATVGIGINPLVAIGYAWVAGTLSTLLLVAYRADTSRPYRLPLPPPSAR